VLEGVDRSLARLGLVAGTAILTGVALAGMWHLAVTRTLAASAWQNADEDHDGLPLSDDLDPDGDGLAFGLGPGLGAPDTDDVLLSARDLLGTFTDPLHGQYGNLLGRAGFVVCVDVPVTAWLRAGVPFPALLRASAAAHPEWFALDAQNRPDDANFVRRTRNYRALFTHHPDLVVDARPHLADWAFYGETHVALVSAVDGAGYTVIEAYGPTVERRGGAEVERRIGATAEFGRTR